MEKIVFKASFVKQFLFLQVALRFEVDGTLTVALTWWGRENCFIVYSEILCMYGVYMLLCIS